MTSAFSSLAHLKSFEKIIPQEKKYIQESFDNLLKNFSLKYFKIGLVPNIEIASKLGSLIAADKPEILVIDPILKSGTGKKLFLKKDLNSLIQNLYKKATLLTPNMYELKTLTNKKNIIDGILFLLDQGIENVYVTGELKKGRIRNHLYSKGEIVNIDEVPNTIKNLYKTVWETKQKHVIEQAAGISSSADATAITIDSSENVQFAGNVGIGVLQPSYALEVDGTIYAEDIISVSANVTVSVTDATVDTVNVTKLTVSDTFEITNDITVLDNFIFSDLVIVFLYGNQTRILRSLKLHTPCS